MIAETERIINHDINFLPLKSYANIHEGNSLRTDWNSICNKSELDYIIGNPPFVGYSLQSKEQKSDLLQVFVDKQTGKPYKTAGKIDYVSAWFYKVAEMMQGTNIRAALVSTNSITQGEQVAAIWKPLQELFGIHINFAHRTFQWDSEAAIKAHVHVVVIGFSCTVDDNQPKMIFDNGQTIQAEHINAYLMDAPDVYIESRTSSLCDVPKMIYGAKPTDGGNLLLNAEETEELLKKEPQIKPYIKRLLGSQEFINNKERYCLWLVGASPALLRQCPNVMKRIQGVKEFRLTSTKAATRKKAELPALFDEPRFSEDDYIIVPRVSSENRKYIPMGFMDKEAIASDAVQIIPSATLYHFGVLESNVHMAWMRAVCGRLKSDYRYSKDIVYNNFPWPEATDEQCAEIVQAAQRILDARQQYPDSSLADLYDPTLMPHELLKAHRDNDRLVMRLYGFPTSMTETECVAQLIKMYDKIKKH